MAQSVATKRRKMKPLTTSVSAERLTEGDYIEGLGVVDALFIKQLVVYLVAGEPHIANRNTQVMIRLEDDGL